MRFLAALLCLVFLSIGTVHASETPTNRYTLRLGDKEVGERTVTIRQLETPTGTLRLLQGWTSFAIPLPTGKFQYRQRIAARLGEGNFTAAIDDNGNAREIQAHRAPDGAWQVTIISGGALKSWALPANAIDLASTDFVDGEQTLWKLEALAATAEDGSTPILKVLAAETGAILEGPLKDLGIDELEVGDRTVAAHGFTWSPEGQATTLWYTAEGLLVGWSSQVGGQRLEGLIDAASISQTLAPRIEDVSGDIEEEAL